MRVTTALYISLGIFGSIILASLCVLGYGMYMLAG